MGRMDNVLQDILKTKNKLLICDAATYTFVGSAALAGALGLPYSLYVFIFNNGSFSRILGACLVCVACWFGIRWTSFFKQRIYYIDTLRDHGYTHREATQAWNYYLLGKHDALSVVLAKQAKPAAQRKVAPSRPGQRYVPSR